jgi:propionyl-CoA carboxylase alpha chain
MHLPRFTEGRLTTNLIAEEYPEGYVAPLPTGGGLTRLVALAAARHLAAAVRDAAMTGRTAGKHYTPSADWTVTAGDQRFPVTVVLVDGGADVTAADGTTTKIRGEIGPHETGFSGFIDGESVVVQIEAKGSADRLVQGGCALSVRVMTARAAELLALMPQKAAADTSRLLLSPMPGLLVSLAVKEGDSVKAGEPLAVVEAMKMENVLRAEKDVTIGKILAKTGASLAVDQVILEFA